MSEPLPPSVARLFWDVDADRVDPQEHADYVLGRVMAHGDWEAMCWLRRTFSKESIADYLVRKGQQLSPRDRAYWALVSGARIEIPGGGGRPPWAGP